MCYAFESVEIFWAWDAPPLVAKAWWQIEYVFEILDST